MSELRYDGRVAVVTGAGGGQLQFYKPYMYVYSIAVALSVTKLDS